MAECSSSTKWACVLCTYMNYKTSLKCTVCLNPRQQTPLIIEEAAVAGVSGISSSENLQLAVNCEERWSCSTCTYLNCLRTKKCIQCHTDRPLRYGSDPSLNNSLKPNNSPNQSSLYISRALNKWTCTACTFDNWPNTKRCTMCGTDKPETNISLKICNDECTANEEVVDGLTRSFANSTISKEFNKSEHYTSALDIYLRRFAANDHLECSFFKAASSIARGDIEVINNVVEYLINEGNVQRRFSSLETRLLNLRGFFRVPFEVGDSLIDIAKKYDCADLVKLMRRITSADEKLPCVLNCAKRNRIYAKVAQFMAVRNGNFNAQFIAHPYNFSILKFPVVTTEYNLEIMNAMLKAAPSIPPTYCFVDCYDTINNMQNVVGRPPNFLMKNRGGTHSLFDAIFQSMFGICDRYNILRAALKYTMIHSDHFFKQRWRDQVVRMARDCGITLSAENLDNDWEETLNVVTSEDDCLEPIHIWALSHVVCRPIVVVSMSNPIELEDLEMLEDDVMSRQKIHQQRNHTFEGIYLPILWASPPVSRSPLILAFRNGQFYAVIVSDGLYQHNEDVQRFFKIPCSRRNDNLFRFLTLSELENSNLLAQYISLALRTSNFIAIRRDPHPFLFETLLFYFNWTCGIHCCLEGSAELKMPMLEQKIDSSFDLSHLRYNSGSEKSSIFGIKALNVLKRHQLNNSSLAETSRSEPIVFNSEEDDDEVDDDEEEEEEEDNESLADVPA